MSEKKTSPGFHSRRRRRGYAECASGVDQAAAVGKQSRQAEREAAGHSARVIPARARPPPPPPPPCHRHQHRSIISISCPSSTYSLFHHLKYFGRCDATTNNHLLARSLSKRLFGIHSHATLAAERGNVRVFELRDGDRGVRGSGPPIIRLARPRAFSIGPLSSARQ